MGDFSYVIRVFPVCRPTVRCGGFRSVSSLQMETEDNGGQRVDRVVGSVEGVGRVS